MLRIKKTTFSLFFGALCVLGTSVTHAVNVNKNSAVDLNNGFQGFFVDWLPFMQPHESVVSSTLFKAQPKLSYETLFNTNQYYNVGLGVHYQLKKNWFLSSELIYHYLGQPSTASSQPLTHNIDMPYLSKAKINQNMSLLASISYSFPTS